MASGKTTNLELNQWTKTDPVCMEEFNADNRKIDEAISNSIKIITGTYIGDGAATRTIPLEFTPRAVFVTPADGKPFYVTTNSNSYYHYYFYGGFVIEEHPLSITRSGETYDYLKIVDYGITVVFQQLGTGSSQVHSLYTNGNNTVYYYIAIR